MALGTPVIGTAAAGSGSSPAVPYPASVGAGDQLLMICVQRPSSIGGGTFTPPTGWTTLLTLIDKGGYGSATTDTGNTNLFIAAKDALAAGGETGTLTATVGGNNAAATAMVRVPTGGGRITFDVTGGEDTSAGSVSVALAADPGIKSGDVLLWGMAIPTDVTTPSQFSAHSVTATGATIGSATELVEFDSTAGNDLGGFAAWASCTAGASSGVPTVAATAGGTTTNVRGPVGLVVIRENAGTVLDRFNKSQYITTYGGDLTATNVLTNVNAGARIRSTNSVDDHRYYETLIGSLNSSEQMLAVGNSSASMSGFGEGADLTSYKSGGNVHVNGTYAATIASFAAGDIVGTEIGPAQGVRWTVNGGTPSSWFALPSGTDFYHVSMLRVLDTGQQTQTLNFGQSDGSGFAYSVPSGAQGWDEVAPPSGTGSGSVTFAALTTAGSGLLANQAAAGFTFGALTATGAGSLTGVGSATLALAAMSTVAAGQPYGSGSASVTFGALTLAAAGGSSGSAAANITFAGLALSGAGTLSQHGSASVTFGALTTAGAGVGSLLGSATLTFASLAIAAAGGSSSAGSASIAFAPLLLTGTGALLLTGFGSILFAPLSLYSAPVIITVVPPSRRGVVPPMLARRGEVPPMQSRRGVVPPMQSRRGVA